MAAAAAPGKGLERAGEGRRAGAVQMGKAGKLRGREGACSRPGGLRAGAAPPPAAAVSALGGAGRPPGMRGLGSGPRRFGARAAGSLGCQGERAPQPGRREGWVLGWQERMRGAFFFSSSQSFVELAVAAKLPRESRCLAVRAAERVVLGALCINNPVLCALLAGDPMCAYLCSGIFSIQARLTPTAITCRFTLVYITQRRRNIISPLSDG